LIQVLEKYGQVGAPLFKLVHLSLDDGTIKGKVYLRSASPYDGSRTLEMSWTAQDPYIGKAVCDLFFLDFQKLTRSNHQQKRESPWELLDLMPQPNTVEEYVKNR
jgi:hypothetical protein